VYWILGFELPITGGFLSLFIPKQWWFRYLPGLFRRISLLVAFLIGFPFLFNWWGVQKTLSSFNYFVIMGRTYHFNFEHVLKQRRNDISGVLHVGAHSAEEAYIYKKLKIAPVLWIEARPDLIEKINGRLESLCLLNNGHYVRHGAVWSVSDVYCRLRIATNDMSSSLLNLGKSHQKYFPFVRKASENPEIEINTVTIRDLVEQFLLEMNHSLSEMELEEKQSSDNKFSVKKFNFLYLNVQGAELPALKGCGNGILSNLDYVLTGISIEDHFQNGTRLDSLDEYLGIYGLVREATCLPPIGQGMLLSYVSCRTWCCTNSCSTL